jgi:ABC-type branched-subunit amino acid transport system ATPase component
MSEDPATDIRDDEWAIDVSHVTKRFRLQGASRSLKTAALDLLRGRAAQTFTALDDVSLRVRRGETVGIVGANGAGKSTLLSIIARTLSPTSGTARTRGTVSSLLERGLIEVAGRLEAPGRPAVFRTTDAFLRTMGVTKLSELPVLPEISGSEGLEKIQNAIDKLTKPQQTEQTSTEDAPDTNSEEG